MERFHLDKLLSEIVSDQSIVKLPLFSKLRNKHEVGDEMEVSTIF